MSKAADARLPRRLPVEAIEPGARWVRIHPARKEALWFGPSRGTPPLNRFDDPAGEYRLCYLSTQPAGAFAETFLRNPPVRILAWSDLSERCISTIEVRRAVRLAALGGPGLSRAGVTTEIASQGAYARSQAFARALWLHPDRPDGIIYRCRHDDSAFSIALFDRARTAAATVACRALTDDPRQLADLLKRYGVALTR